MLLAAEPIMEPAPPPPMPRVARMSLKSTSPSPS
ncbi:MAG: hypothetical protein K6F20_11840 [Bacteroidaceae bacterium]|nr:hypothetical protein [Bacteroidaceae bacterium]